MNKYDAAQTMNAGTTSKLSLDHQQTASNQSSVSTGTRNIHDNTDSLKHEGTTFMRNQDGELLRMTGNFEQTGGAWKFSGNVQNLSTGETYTGNMSGMAKDMNSMQQGLNVDDVSMTGKERANLGDVKGENVAFIQGTVVDSNLSASDIIHKDKTRTENTTDEKNYSYERTTDIDTSRTEKHNNSYSSGDTVTINTKNQIKVGDEVLTGGKITQEGNKAVIEGTTADGMKYTATVGNAEINKDENGNYTVGGQVAQSRKEGGNSTNINNSYSEQAGQKLALGDEITGHGGARGVLKEGFSKYIGNSEDAEIAKDAFFNNLTQNQNAILSQSGSNKTLKEFNGALKSAISASVGGEILGTGLKATAEASYQFALKQNGENATVADFNRIMNEQIYNNITQQVAFGKIKPEDFDKALGQAYDAYENILKDIAKGTGEISFPDTDPLKQPENPIKK